MNFNLKVRQSFLLFVFYFTAMNVYAQGRLSGDFSSNVSIYDYDENIGTNTTQYLREHSSAESWLFLNYRQNNIHLEARFDMFLNSPLLDPEEAYTEAGIPFFAATIDLDRLRVTAGSFYDQYGSGIIFRAYEDRLLGLDYAIQGVRARYRLTDDLSLSAFAGRQKHRFDYHDQVIKGANLEYSHRFEESGISLSPGVAFVNRTLDRETMDRVVDEINQYELEERFIPTYNLYAYTFYNTLAYRGLSWYVELAGKTSEAVRDFDSRRLQNQDGYVAYTALNYSRSGFGISLQYKLNNTFVLRTSPFTEELVGTINYMPSLTRQHSYRLPARYTASSFETGEEGFQVDVTYSINRNNTLTANYSQSHDLDGRELFREIYLDYSRRYENGLRTTVGAQMIWYNQDLFEGKPGYPIVETITPFAEIIYRITRRMSLKTELQYLHTDQDMGDFAYALLELNISPTYSFSVSNMANVRPVDDEDVIHFYSAAVAYRIRQSRFALSYAKQPEGVVCTGGVCRVEPAFSGARFSLNTSF
jgi:hypothetical protein